MDSIKKEQANIKSISKAFEDAKPKFGLSKALTDDLNSLGRLGITNASQLKGVESNIRDLVKNIGKLLPLWRVIFIVHRVNS